MIDRKDASRDERVRLVVAQHETIQRQKRMIVAQFASRQIYQVHTVRDRHG